MIFFDEGKKLFPNGGNINFCFGHLDWQKPWNSEKRPLMEKRCYLNTYLTPNGFLICTNFLIHLEYWSEQYSSSSEYNCESYKSVVWEIKSVYDSILWIVLSKLSHAYIDLDLIITQVSYVLLVITFSMWFFLSCYTRYYFFIG